MDQHLPGTDRAARDQRLRHLLPAPVLPLRTRDLETRRGSTARASSASTGAIILPLAVPALLTLALFHFMYNWNDLLWPLGHHHRSDMRTLPAGLTSFVGPARHRVRRADGRHRCLPCCRSRRASWLIQRGSSRASPRPGIKMTGAERKVQDGELPLRRRHRGHLRSAGRAPARRPLDEYELTEHYAGWHDDLAPRCRDAARARSAEGFPGTASTPEPGTWDVGLDRSRRRAPARARARPIVDLVHYGTPLLARNQFTEPGLPAAGGRVRGPPGRALPRNDPATTRR